MNGFRMACVAVVAVAVAVFSGVGAAAHYAGAQPQTTSGMSPFTQLGLTAAGDAVGAREMQVAPSPSYVDLGLTAAGDRVGVLEMQVAAMSTPQQNGIPVQWHDIFTGVGAAVGAMALAAIAGVGIARRRHTHGGRFTLAH